MGQNFPSHIWETKGMSSQFSCILVTDLLIVNKIVFLWKCSTKIDISGLKSKRDVLSSPHDNYLCIQTRLILLFLLKKKEEDITRSFQSKNVAFLITLILLLKKKKFGQITSHWFSSMNISIQKNVTRINTETCVLIYLFRKRTVYDYNYIFVCNKRWTTMIVNRIGGVMVRCARLECGRSCVRAPVGLNQRL